MIYDIAITLHCQGYCLIYYSYQPSSKIKKHQRSRNSTEYRSLWCFQSASLWNFYRSSAVDL